jgi:predicted permease
MAKSLCLAARFAWRRPLLSGGIVLSLALGIGINTAVFCFLDQLFLHPLPAVSRLDRLLAVYSRGESGGGYLPLSYPNYLELAERCRSLSALAAYQSISVGLSGQPRTEQIAGEMVSADYFRLLGVRTVLGRTFLPEEGRISGGQAVAVLGQSFWRRRFASDPGILDRGLILNGLSVRVVGVVEEAYRGTSAMNTPDLWVPLSLFRQVFAAPDLFPMRKGRILQVVGRLKDGVDPRTAQAEISAIAAALAREYPDDNRGQEILALPLAQANLHPNVRKVLGKAGFLLAAVAAILLLTACANIANLLLVSAAQRQTELATRFALGSSRGQLVRLLVGEALLLALVGGLVSTAVGAATWMVVWKFRPPFIADNAVRLHFDLRLVVFTFLVSLATVLIFGLVPALLATAGRERLSFREAPPSSTGIPFLRDGIVAAQLALSTICLSFASLFVSDLLIMGRIDPGFEADHLLTASFDLKMRNYSEPSGRAFLDRLVEKLRVLPGVRFVGLGENPPLGGFRLLRDVLPNSARAARKVLAGASIIDSRYFQSMGIPIVAGRSFQNRDRVGAAPVVIINETLKQQLWPDRDPIGELLQLVTEGRSLEIVGVAHNAKYVTLGENPRAVIYLPMSQRYSSRVTVHVQTAAAPAALLKKIQDAVTSVDPDLPLVDVRTGRHGIDRTLWASRLTASLLAFFGFLALTLATLGVYTVAAVSAVRRRTEIGIRIALGAGRLRVVNLFLLRALATIAVGAGGGLLAAATLVRWFEITVLGDTGRHPLTFVFIASVLLVAGLGATALPALRAARADPVLNLRGE